MIFALLSLALLLVSVMASGDHLVVTFDPATSAALVRFQHRLRMSLTTFAMESAFQELSYTLGVKPEDEEDAEGQQMRKKKVAHTSGSNGF